MLPEVAIGAIGRIQVCVMLTPYSKTQQVLLVYQKLQTVPDQIKPDVFIPKLLLRHINGGIQLRCLQHSFGRLQLLFCLHILSCTQLCMTACTIVSSQMNHHMQRGCTHIGWICLLDHDGTTNFIWCWIAHTIYGLIIKLELFLTAWPY